MNANSAHPADCAVGGEFPAKPFPNTRRYGAGTDLTLMCASAARSCESSGAKVSPRLELPCHWGSTNDTATAELYQNVSCEKHAGDRKNDGSTALTIYSVTLACCLLLTPMSD